MTEISFAMPTAITIKSIENTMSRIMICTMIVAKAFDPEVFGLPSSGSSTV